MMTRIEEWIHAATNLLRGVSDLPLLESEVILAFVLNKSRAWIITHPDTKLEQEKLVKANDLLMRLSNGEPLPYLTGIQAFYGLDFVVSPDVLIPRPETELLVEECIKWFDKNPGRRNMVDVGTGSGIIAVTLANRFHDLSVTAIDVSEKVLSIARINSKRFNVDKKVTFIKNDLFHDHQESYDLIAANLPYIPEANLINLSVTKFEPLLALNGGKDGLDLIRILLDQSRSNIKPGGLIILETQNDQAFEVAKIASVSFPNAIISVLKDLAEYPRICKIQL